MNNVIDFENRKKRIFGRHSKDDYLRNYEIYGTNILDVLFRNGANGLTVKDFVNFFGLKESSIQKRLTKMVDRKNCKKYMVRERLKNGFIYFPVGKKIDIEKAYVDIMSSKYEKNSLKQGNLFGSTRELPYKYEVCSNVVATLKSRKSEWNTEKDISTILGVVYDKKLRNKVKNDLQRWSKCHITIVEKKIENKKVFYRLHYKYWKHTVEEIKKIGNKMFKHLEKPPEVKNIKTQVINRKVEKNDSNQAVL